MVSTREESIAAPDGGTFAGHLTVPDGGNGPGLLLLQEIFGVGDFLKAKADDLAELGYVVLCPDVFWRIEPGIALAARRGGDGGGVRLRDPLRDRGRRRHQGRPTSAPRSPTCGRCPRSHGHQAGVWATASAACSRSVVACHCDPDACVSYYGSGIADRLNECDDLTCPILFHFGGNDPYIPNEQVDAIRARLGERPNVEIHVQHQAGHAFENHLAPQFHDPNAAAASWPLTVEFLQRNLH